MNDRNTLLWSLSKDLSKASYLMGTMHVRDVRAFQNYETAVELISYCKYYYAEMDLHQAELLQNPSDFFMPEGINLIALIGERKYRKIQKSLKQSFGFELDYHQHLLPFIITNIVAENILQNDHQQPLDHILWKFAEGAGLEMGGLESFVEQRSIMKKIPLAFQLKSLKDLAKNPSRFRKNLLKLVDYYLDENIHLLFKLSKKSLGKLRKLMLYDRNYLMANRMSSLMDQGQCFFAVGAAHLDGQKGVLNILKQGGIKLKPVH